MIDRKLTGLGAAMALVLIGTAGAGVVKTKTKSNQSNDRILQGDVIAGLEASFAKLDLNNDGQLDSAEQRPWRALRQSPSTQRAVLRSRAWTSKSARLRHPGLSACRFQQASIAMEMA